MKCLFILSLSLNNPGPSVHLLTNVIDGLLRAGHSVHVIEERYAGGGTGLTERLNLTVDTARVRARDKNSFAGRYVEKYRYARATAPLIRAHRDADLVYVHSCNTLGVFVSLVRRIMPRAALVLNVQDIFPENASAAGILGKNHPAYKVFSMQQHRAYRRADAIITLSDDMKKTLVTLGAPGDKVNAIPLWSYSDEMAPIDDQNNLFLQAHPEETQVVRAVYAGNVGTMQNVELVLRTACLMKDDASIRFLIIGGGARLGALTQFARDHQLDNVHFYPMQPSELAPHLYAMAHVNLITLNRGVIYTAFPSKTAPCCAMARPMIACVDPESDYAAMIRGLDGCAVSDPDDERALAALIRQMADQPRTISRGARSLYQTKLSARAGVDAHLALFERLMKELKL